MILPSKTTIYAVLALATVVAFGATYFIGRSDGKDSARDAMQAAVIAANLKTAQTEQQARRISEDSGHEIETLRAARDEAFDRGRKSIGPIRLCKPSRSGDVPGTASPAAGANGPDPAEGVPVPVGEDSRSGSVSRDIGPDLVILAESCQRDHDIAAAWHNWWTQQQSAR